MKEAADAGAAGKVGAAGDHKGEGGKAAAGRAAADAGHADGTARDAGGPPDSESMERDMRVTIHFAAKLGERAFACGEHYADQGKTKAAVTPVDLRFYVQDLRLITRDGHEQAVQLDTRAPFQTADVALLDFEDATGSCAGDAQTNDTITGRVPAGDYNAIRFSNGVPMALNHSDPKQFPPPLKSPGMSWNWLLGLRFMKAELETEHASDLDGGAAVGGALHLGSTACSGNPAAGQISCNKPNRNAVQLSEYALDHSVIVLDVATIFRDSDLARGAECHAATAECDSMFKALGLSYASGAAAESQSAYHLEAR